MLGFLAGCGDDGNPDGLGEQPTLPQPDTRTAEPSTPAPEEPSTTLGPDGAQVVRTVASGLAVPWGIAFLPDGRALVTERDSTRVLLLDPRGDGEASVRTVAQVDAAAPRGEGGLLGIAVSPYFATDQRVFLYASTESDNRVLRGTFDGTGLTGLEPIFTGIPNGFIHDGGRLAFGPDDFLYVSTGEIGEPALAQDPESLAGKILRITADGEPAPGNPVEDSAVWSMGHRNVQGLAFDDQDRLWASEFGQDTWDELNRIDKGRNYGWPLAEGRSDLNEYRNPFAQWATDDASPSGLAYLDGSLWMGALRGERLWQVPLAGDTVGDPVDWFVGDYGRVRSVAVTPQGTLWVTTSNRDGRGTPAAQDDRILEIAVG